MPAGERRDSTELRPLLLVTRSKLLRRLLETLLTRADFDVRSATTAERALELMATVRYAVAVVEDDLDDGNANQLLHHAREEMKLEVPILLLSTVKRGDTEARAALLGANDCLTTPIGPGEFIERVRRLASGGP